MAQPVLVLRDVTVRRGTSTLLTGVDWTVRDGESWAVLGSNGAGKTTLLQVAATTLRPTSGEVEVLGERLGPGIGRRRLRAAPAHRPREPVGRRADAGR